MISLARYSLLNVTELSFGTTAMYMQKINIEGLSPTLLMFPWVFLGTPCLK